MRRLWRWLCCRTGHHRETVRLFYSNPGFVELLCVDCFAHRDILIGAIRTPSRRYALRAKGQETA